jgi:hypothetical protein
MQTDTNLIFVGGNTSGSIVFGGAGANFTARSAVLDLATGLMLTGTTYAASPLSGGQFLINPNLLPIFEDLGPGAMRLRLAAIIGAAFAGGTSLNIQIQGAADASGGVYPANLSGLTWTTYAETGAIPTADLGNAAAAGVNPRNSVITLPDWPDVLITTALPRFISLNFVGAGTFTTGAISFAGVFTYKPDFTIGKYAGGFQVAP